MAGILLFGDIAPKNHGDNAESFWHEIDDWVYCILYNKCERGEHLRYAKLKAAGRQDIFWIARTCRGNRTVQASAMGESSPNMGILYADVCNSVRLYESLGDEEAHRLIHDCLSKLVDITRQFRGTVIRTQGDGVMSVFGTADQTFDAARQMQQTYREGHITLTAGFNYGSVISDDGDVYGDAVNLAARVAALARPGEILLTGETVRELSADLKDTVRLFDTTTVRGRRRPVEIFSVRAEPDQQTTYVPSSVHRAAKSRQPGMLTLLHGKRAYRVGDGVQVLVMGRDKRCDVVVKSYFASRRHAVIEVSRDRFVLTDQSSNGTFVAPGNGHDVFLKRESLPLLGNGTISLGAAPSDDERHTIRYAVNDAN